MGCCLAQGTEKFQESIDQYSNIRPIEMKLDDVVSQTVIQELVGSPLTDGRGDFSVKINRQRFVASFSGNLSRFYRVEEEIGAGSYGKIYLSLIHI